MNKSKILSSILFTVFGILLTVISILMFIRPSSTVARADEIPSHSMDSVLVPYGTVFTLKPDSFGQSVETTVFYTYLGESQGDGGLSSVSYPSPPYDDSSVSGYVRVACSFAPFSSSTRAYALMLGLNSSRIYINPPISSTNLVCNIINLWGSSVQRGSVSVPGESTTSGFTYRINDFSGFSCSAASGSFNDSPYPAPEFDSAVSPISSVGDFFDSSTQLSFSFSVACPTGVYFSGSGYHLLDSLFDISSSSSEGEYLKGYQDGLNKGQSDSFVNPLVQALVPVHNFLETDFFGVSLADFLSVVIFVCLAIIFLRLFAGG